MGNTVTKDRARFATIPNDLLNASDVSLSAKGMYAFMEGKPPGWNFTVRSMAKQLKEGATAIGNALKELRACGWVSYTKHSDGRGSYHLYFERQIAPEPENPVKATEPKPENPSLGYPMMGKPNPISKKEPIVRKTLSNKELQGSAPTGESPDDQLEAPKLDFITKDGKSYHVSDTFEAELRATYTKIDVGYQLKKARLWLIANPSKRKTAPGMTRFLNHWMGNQKPTAEIHPLQSRHTGFADRDYSEGLIEGVADNAANF